MPTTSVAKSSGAMIIRISRRNASAIGRMATPASGHTPPSTHEREADEDLRRGRRAGETCGEPHCGSAGRPAAASCGHVGAHVLGDRRDGLLLVERELAVDRQGEAGPILGLRSSSGTRM